MLVLTFPFQIAEAAFNESLRALVHSAPVLLFMKGTPQDPKCGFSKKTVKLLRDHQIAFSSFDILSDDQVRQGLKKFSNWPTYPQLYVKGKLVGGLDILNEMAVRDLPVCAAGVEKMHGCVCVYNLRSMFFSDGILIRRKAT